MRPVFCGNFEYDARQSELERLFRKYGKVDRVDMKSGFAFVYMEDDRDAEDAIRGLDRIEFGRKGRRLRVEWTKQERSTRRPEVSRKSASSTRPTKTLFVINFDPYNTRQRDLERHFDPFGKILNVRIRKNFAFIQFENQEDATKALEGTNMSKLMDRIITVEYAIKDDDERRNGGYSPERTRDRSPRRGGYDRGPRSPSPYSTERGSPDYGHARGRGRSPPARERGSPVYARGPSRSPVRKGRDAEYGRGGRSPSPSPRKERDTEYGRGGRSPSPRKERDAEYGRGGRSPSPRKETESRRSPSPRRDRSPANIGNGGSDAGKKVSPDYARSRSPSLEPGERVMSPADFGRERSPAYSDGESPPPPCQRYASRSPPPARERSRS